MTIRNPKNSHGVREVSPVDAMWPAMITVDINTRLTGRRSFSSQQSVLTRYTRKMVMVCASTTDWRTDDEHFAIIVAAEFANKPRVFVRKIVTRSVSVVINVSTPNIVARTVILQPCRSPHGKERLAECRCCRGSAVSPWWFMTDVWCSDPRPSMHSRMMHARRLTSSLPQCTWATTRPNTEVQYNTIQYNIILLKKKAVRTQLNKN